MLQISTTIPIPLQQVPARAQVVRIFATAHNPYTGKAARVIVRACYPVNILAQGGRPAYKVADVIEIGAQQGYQVSIDSLSNVTAFCVQEVAE